MVKNILLILFCSTMSVVVLALILGVLAYTGTTPFGQFTDIILQYQNDPSAVFADENYYNIFVDALNFILYFIISPIVVLTGITGALVSKRNEMLVGVASAMPMLIVYVIPVFSVRNLIVALACIIIIVCCIVAVQKKKRLATKA